MVTEGRVPHDSLAERDGAEAHTVDPVTAQQVGAAVHTATATRTALVITRGVRKVTSHAGSPGAWTSAAVLSVPTDEDVGDAEGAGGRAAMRATANAANAMQAPTTKAVV